MEQGRLSYHSCYGILSVAEIKSWEKLGKGLGECQGVSCRLCGSSWSKGGYRIIPVVVYVSSDQEGIGLLVAWQSADGFTDLPRTCKNKSCAAANCVPSALPELPGKASGSLGLPTGLINTSRDLIHEAQPGLKHSPFVDSR